VAGLAVAATPIAASAATGHADQARRACAISITQSANKNNAGYYKVKVNSESGCSPFHQVTAQVTCHSNTGGTSTVRDGGRITASGQTSTAGCFNGSHPTHGGWIDDFTATYHSFF
jgi:hypothetical protein